MDKHVGQFRVPQNWLHKLITLKRYLPVLQLSSLLDAVVAGGGAGVTVFLGDLISQLKNRVLLVKEHEVVILHLDLCDLLRHAVVFI